MDQPWTFIGGTWPELSRMGDGSGAAANNDCERKEAACCCRAAPETTAAVAGAAKSGADRMVGAAEDKADGGGRVAAEG